VIIAAFAQVAEAEARTWTPHCVFVDGRNRRSSRAPNTPDRPSYSAPGTDGTGFGCWVSGVGAERQTTDT